jgi:hypothetical protein
MCHNIIIMSPDFERLQPPVSQEARDHLAATYSYILSPLVRASLGERAGVVTMEDLVSQVDHDPSRFFGVFEGFDKAVKTFNETVVTAETRLDMPHVFAVKQYAAKLPTIRELIILSYQKKREDVHGYLVEQVEFNPVFTDAEQQPPMIPYNPITAHFKNALQMTNTFMKNREAGKQDTPEEPTVGVLFWKQEAVEGQPDATSEQRVLGLTFRLYGIMLKSLSRDLNAARLSTDTVLDAVLEVLAGASDNPIHEAVRQLGWFDAATDGHHLFSDKVRARAMRAAAPSPSTDKQAVSS